jgi:uncharacterized protein YdhG (YjbR/CyaY superfamily)
MVSSKAATVGDYLAELPAERREVLEALRGRINAALPAGYVEAMRYGMLSWEIPLARYPDTYNGQPLVYVALAAQKNACSLYLNCVYADAARVERLQAAFRAAGKQPDMGKSCIRFRRLADLALPAIEAEVASTPPAEFIARYAASRTR